MGNCETLPRKTIKEQINEAKPEYTNEHKVECVLYSLRSQERYYVCRRMIINDVEIDIGGAYYEDWFWLPILTFRRSINDRKIWKLTEIRERYRKPVDKIQSGFGRYKPYEKGIMVNNRFDKRKEYVFDILKTHLKLTEETITIPEVEQKSI